MQAVIDSPAFSMESKLQSLPSFAVCPVSTTWDSDAGVVLPGRVKTGKRNVNADLSSCRLIHIWDSWLLVKDATAARRTGAKHHFCRQNSSERSVQTSPILVLVEDHTPHGCKHLAPLRERLHPINSAFNPLAELALNYIGEDSSKDTHIAP